MLITFKRLKQQKYKGIPQKAAHNLHKDVFALIKPYIKPEMKALELACGNGAFSQRLLDYGLKVHICDINIKDIKASAEKILQVDLNTEQFYRNFNEKYDVVIGMEIIEHLENPRNFFRNVKQLINNDGIIVVSTPNISSFHSRLRFLMRGTFLSFEKTNLDIGHITPLNFFQLETIFQELDLKIIRKDHGGSLPIFDISSFSSFQLIRNLFLPFIIPFMKGDKFGRCLIYVLKKAD